ncbi:pantoate kinase [Sediminispirochaeta bajacaliforniensis]|uniref:pantoate kinase n=1 Tax=Sediminispirochaeta bajacaliforniensis TaxID=148 RepID=UPI0003816832|nr:hypothetical protein [Sediminispirochaeta bajacaliforniensis]
MITAKAFSPGHITGLFSIRDDEDSIDSKGSIGAGFSIARGVTTTVTLSSASQSGGHSAGDKTIYRSNGKERSDLVVSKRLISLFQDAALLKDVVIREISHSIEIPQGSGFGSSGAGVLSLALALNHALGSPLSAEEAGAMAHRAEVLCKTGLGTVIGEFCGGVEIRKKQGAPGTGEVVSIPISDDLNLLFVVYRKISTSSALSDPDIRRRINDTGEQLIADLLCTPTLEAFLWASRAFDERSGLITPEVRRLFDHFDAIGAPTAMLMFGNAAFALFPDKESAEAEAQALSRSEEKGYLFTTTSSKQGGCVIHE